MIRRIVVGIDGSPASLSASEIAFSIGKHFDIPVVGVYVIDTRLIDESFIADLAGVLGFTYYEGISAKVKEFLEKQGDVILEEFSALGRKAGVKVSVVQVEGVPYKEISTQADPEDLVVVGRQGRKPIKGFLLGSNSEKVARYSKCPVLVVPEGETKMKKALVAYDGSENAKLALRLCSSLRPVFNYEVDVLYVSEEADLSVKEEVENLLGEDFTFHRLDGLPEERIVGLAKEKDSDIVFLGAFGKGRFREMFLGSITLFVLHTLNKPVLLAKSLRER